jgi:hypothetical protein
MFRSGSVQVRLRSQFGGLIGLRDISSMGMSVTYITKLKPKGFVKN